MGDLTDQLIALTEDAKAGAEKAVEERLDEIRKSHEAALKVAVGLPEVAARVRKKLAGDPRPAREAGRWGARSSGDHARVQGRDPLVRGEALEPASCGGPSSTRESTPST